MAGKDFKVLCPFRICGKEAALIDVRFLIRSAWLANESMIFKVKKPLYFDSKWMRS